MEERYFLCSPLYPGALDFEVFLAKAMGMLKILT